MKEQQTPSDDFEKQPFKDQCVLITGASRGIGAATARHLAGLGAKMGLTYSSQREKGEQTLKSLKGQGHLLLQMDIGNRQSVREGFLQFMEHFKTCSALVNNAGITKDRLLLRMRPEDFDTVIQTNLYGTFYCCQEAAKHMVKARKGVIVNVSSVVAQTGNPGQVNYTASKAGIEGLTRTLARELAARNIRVNAIAPGMIQTDMLMSLNEEQKASLSKNIPLKRMGTTQEVAQAIAFLLKSEYITGQTLAVNGGLAL